MGIADNTLIIFTSNNGPHNQGGADPDAPIELYRLTDDIGEENNLAEQYSEMVKKMDRLMNEAHLYSENFSFEHEKNK